MQRAWIVLAVLLLAGCSGAPAPRSGSGHGSQAGTAATSTPATAVQAAQPSPPSDLAPADRQTLRLNLGAEPLSLDPAHALSAADTALVKLLWRGLFTLDPAGAPIPALAAELPTTTNGGISADGRTYTITLRAGQRLSNGAPLTSAELVYAIKRLLDPRIGGFYASLFNDIAGAEAFTSALGTRQRPLSPTAAELQALRGAVGVHALDAVTLQFTLTAPSTSFVARLTLPAVYPLQQAAVEQAGERPMDAGTLIGNGPYVLKDHAPKDHITLVANPDYTLAPAPFINKITFQIIDDPQVAFVAYRNGELDAVNVPNADLQPVLSDASLQSQLKREPIQQSFGVGFNVHQPPFDSPLVRRAFAQAIDRATMEHVVFGDVGRPGATWLPPCLAGYDPANEAILRFDPQAARQALADAGYPSGRGFPSDVKLLLAKPQVGLYDFLAKAWHDILYVTVQADVADPSTVAARVSQQQYQLRMLGWFGDYPNADDWLPSLWGTGGTTNGANYSNPALDQVLARARLETDPRAQAAQWAMADKLLLQDAAVAVVWHSERLTLWQPKVHGQVAGLVDVLFVGDDSFASLYVVK